MAAANLYTAQDIRVQATMSTDITGATTVEIRYRNPVGTTGAWTATIGTAATGIIYYDYPDTDNTIPGHWVVQAHVVDSSGNVLKGAEASMHILPRVDS